MMRVPLSQPDITRREIDLVNQVLATPYLSMGPMVERFEEAVGRYLGVDHAVAVSSGTAGLHLAVIAAGIGEGDAVITTPFSFVASVNCLLYEGSRPVFVDIDSQTLNLDTDLIEEKIAEGIKAILPVHVFGQPCEMDEILAIAKRHHLKVIEDACEAFGAEFDGRKVGTFGDLGVYAFYPNKQVTTGEGGMVVTDDPDRAALLRSLRNQGREGDGRWPYHPRLGYNYRLDELSCALGVAQLERIEELLAKRERVAALYHERLKAVEGIEIPHLAPRVKMSWFVYVIRLPKEIDRDTVIARLAGEGVSSRPYFPPIHLQPYVQEMLGHKVGDFPIAEAVSRSTLALPFHGNMREEEVEYVCDALKTVVDESDRRRSND